MRLGAEHKTIVKGIKIASKGKGKGVKWELSLDIPDLKGTVDAKEIGGLFIAELIDLIRATWERGQKLPYRPRKMTPQMERRRLLWSALLRDVPTDRKEFLAMLKPIMDDLKATAKASDDYAEIFSYVQHLDRIVWLRDHYTYKRQTQRAIKGIQKSKYRSDIFMPNPDRPPVDDSGIMSNSLRGHYRPSRTYIQKETRRKINTYTQIFLSVQKNRQKGAILAGLNSKNAQFFVNMLRVNKRAFKNTNALLSHGVYWADRKRLITHTLVAYKIMKRAIQFAART